MLTSLEIKNFRGLKNAKFSNLRRVNLILGGNDTGKTSALEALALLLGDENILPSLPTLFRSDASGNDAGENFWAWLVYDRNLSHTFKIRAIVDDSREVEMASVKLSADDSRYSRTHLHLRRSGLGGSVDPVFSINGSGSITNNAVGGVKGFKIGVLSTKHPNSTTDARNYNQVALTAGGEERIERLMHEVEPRLKKLRYAHLPNTSNPLIYIDMGLSQFVPITQMGQAFNRIFHIYTHVLANRINVLLIDEIENGIFSGAMRVIWRGLLALCKAEKVQIFATTHSRECVMAAHAAEKEFEEELLSVQRLQLVKGEIQAVSLGSKHIELAEEMGLEVRS